MSMEEGTLVGVQPRSDGSGSGLEGRRAQATRKLQAVTSHPSFLLVAGLALLAVGSALVAVPLALEQSHKSAGSAPPTPTQQQAAADQGLDAEGVPLDARVSSAQDGSLSDCGGTLGDWQAYRNAAQQAEQAAYGAPAANLTSQQLGAVLGRQPQLLFSTVFWVLSSPAHPWSERFGAAAAVQVDVLNAAFGHSAGMEFRLDGVVHVPASDASVELCSMQWESIARTLLGQGGGSPRAASSSIHILLCEPQGVNGASGVLGGSGGSQQPPQGSAASATLLLRRSVLWQSHTSLVHQLGHFMGLAHPFPDKQTCRLDGDFVADTPQQHAPNTGCSTREGDMHVCQGSGDGALPAVNFMDLTNDTCRQHFSTGQVARMRAMLPALRPQLYAAAQQGGSRVALPLADAFQSGLPPLPLLQQQVADAAAAAHNATAAAAAVLGAAGWVSAGGGGAAASPETSSLGLGRNLTSAGVLGNLSRLYQDPWQQAALAASGQLSSALPACACLGADAQGDIFWTGALNASWPVDAVQLLLPAELLHSGSGDAAGAAAAPVADSTLEQLLVDIRVGPSPAHASNQRCAGSNVALSQLLQTVECQQPLWGPYVTVAAASSRAALQARPLCLCAVRPLSYASAPPQQAAGALPLGSMAFGGRAPLALPAVLLNLSGSAAAQSSGTQSAAEALAPPQPPLGSPRSCSRTSRERHPWWQLYGGLDGLWLRSLRLSAPLACATAGSSSSAAAAGVGLEAAAGCLPAATPNLTVYVSGTPLGGVNGTVDKAALVAAQVCLSAGALPTGQLLELDCGRLLWGRYVAVLGDSQAPAALELCNLQLLGAVELVPAQHLARAPGAQRATPPALQPAWPLPVDGDAGSCLEWGGSGAAAAGSAGGSGGGMGLAPEAAPGSAAQSQEASWEVQLDGSYPLLALRLTGSAALNASLRATLLDAGGAAVAALVASKAAQRGEVLPLAAPTYAASLRLQGFASLCEVQLLAGSSTAALSYRLQPPGESISDSSGGDGSIAPVWVASGDGGSDASAAIDGNHRTCSDVGLGLLLQLGRPYWVESVLLVGGGGTPSAAVAAPQNVSIAMLPHGSPSRFASFGAAWAGATLCAEQVAVGPGVAATARCAQPQLATTLLVGLLPPPGVSVTANSSSSSSSTDGGGVSNSSPAAEVDMSSSTEASASALTVCELTLFGRPAVPTQ